MILVTGGTGFLGRQLVKKISEHQSSTIRCLVRPGTEKAVTEALAKSSPEARLEFVPASFNDSEALKKALEGVEVVYHAAASKSGSFAAMVANTVVGSVNLYEACVAVDVSRVVLVSSMSVIGAAGIPRGGVIDESAPLEPHPELRDAYAFSKLRQEVLAWEYHRKCGLPVVVVRPGVVFGPTASILGPRIGVDVFGIFLHLGGRNEIPLTYVENCAEVIALAGLSPAIDGEVFIAVDDDLPQSRQLLRRYVREVAALRTVRIPYPLLRQIAKINVWYSERTKGHLPALFKPYEVESLWRGHRFVNQKAKQVLGWTPGVPMAMALDHTFSSLAKKDASGL